jgi:glycosyltransferase involved in cell wall biosynthesis
MATNEEHCIAETLLSTLPYANEYIICDNASTDNTIKVCEDFFNTHNMKNQIFNYDWKNFGHNYSYLYELGHKYANSEYLWQIDADDLIHGVVDITNLTKDTYFLQFGTNLKYDRPQIFKNTIKWKHYLVLHGYVAPDPKNTPITNGKISGDYHIECRHLGHRHKNDEKTKYLNDAKTIEDDLAHNLDLDKCDISRYYFYLAQCYFDAKEYNKSIENYQIRIKMNRSVREEIYYSKYRIGCCYESLDQSTDALKWYLDSWMYRPTRSEGLYSAVQLFQKIGKYGKAYKYTMIGKDIPLSQDVLFVETDSYSWGYDFELSFICFYVNKIAEGMKACIRLLNRIDIPNDIRSQVEYNSKFYMPKK